MPITRQNVLDDIASKITNKTTAGSLTNTEDGSNRGLILDYVDQKVPYKSFTAILNQTGTSATLSQLNNELQNPVTFAVAGTGNYTFTSNGSFTLGKTVLFKGVVFGGNGKTNIQFNASTNGDGVNRVSIYVNNDAGSLSDSVFTSMPIEIRVYN